MATLACRVQFLDDTDPFNSTNFPEPSRPPLFTFREDLALGTQLAGVHRLLRAPHKVRPGGRAGPPGLRSSSGALWAGGAAGRLRGRGPLRQAPQGRPPRSPLGRGAPSGWRGVSRTGRGGRPRALSGSWGLAGLSRCRAGLRRDGDDSPAPRR